MQLHEEFKAAYDKIYEVYGRSGERVLAFASLDLSDDGKTEYS